MTNVLKRIFQSVLGVFGTRISTRMKVVLHMPVQDEPTTEDAAKFSDAEEAFFQTILRMAEAQADKLDPSQKTKLFLGCASEFVDAAADAAANNYPGMRVVELGLLAERISKLAFDHAVLTAESRVKSKSAK